MKIAIWHNLPSGGGYRALYDQVRGLKNLGHHVEIWCPESAERDILPIDSIAPIHRHPLVSSGHWRNRSRKLGDAWQRYRDTRLTMHQLDNHVQKCAMEINVAGFDVVLAHPSKLFHMHPMARYTTVPALLYLQEIYRPLHEATPALPWVAMPDSRCRWGTPRYWLNFLINLLDVQADRVVLREECRTAREWDRILCNSYFSRESMVRAYGVDARVCYLGLDLAQFTPAVNPSSNYVLGLGSFTPAKGAELALHSLAQIPIAERPTLRWVSNSSNQEYVKRCEQLAHDSGVEFILEVRVSEGQLLERLQNAIALIYPTHLEPFGYAPLEANACGVPVIGIAEGGVRETVVDGLNGFLVPDRQPEKWAEAIRKLIQDPHLRERMSRQAITWVNEQWSNQAAIIRLENELYDVIRLKQRMSHTS